LATLKSNRERLFVDELAPRHIDEQGRLFHASQLGRSD